MVFVCVAVFLLMLPMSITEDNVTDLTETESGTKTIPQYQSPSFSVQISISPVLLLSTASLSSSQSTPKEPPSSTGPVVGIVMGILITVLVGGIVTATLVYILLFKMRKKLARQDHDLALDFNNECHSRSHTLLQVHNKLYAIQHDSDQAIDPSYYSPMVTSTSTIKEAINPLYSTISQGTNSWEIPGEPTYWAPSSIPKEFYLQLSIKKFNEIDRENIQLSTLLGQGQFGQVSKGTWKMGILETVEVAVKILKNNTSEQDKVKFLQEAAIMGQFHHKNVVKLYGVVTAGQPVMIVIELMVNGDLKEFLPTLQPKLQDTEPNSYDVHAILVDFCQQIASGMEYLSKKSFIHRDLAARNILVSANRQCKIGDFGMARDLMHENFYVSKGGRIPVRWTALEALHYREYSTASDVWSYGVVVFEIWSLGQKPYLECKTIEIVHFIEAGKRMHPPPGCPRAIYKLMIDCWNPNASQRPTFTEVVKILSVSLKELVKDVAEMPKECNSLGGEYEIAKNLHIDLQLIYKT